MAENFEEPNTKEQPDGSAPISAPSEEEPKKPSEDQPHELHEVGFSWMGNKRVLGLISFFLLYLAVGDVWTRKEGGGFWEALLAFLRSYGAILLAWFLILTVYIFVAISYHKVIKPWGGYVLAWILGPIAVWYWAGWYNWWRDVAIGTVTMIVLLRFGGSLLDRMMEGLAKIELWLREKKTIAGHNAHGKASASYDARRRFYAVLTWLLLSWILVSILDFLWDPTGRLSRPLPTTTDRFANIANKNAKIWSAANPPRLGVALSGGGYRAALTHAGVLSALGERGIPIAGLATVSGGSIIGGFYVAGGNPVDFPDAVADGRFNLKRELINFPNLLKLPCPGHIPIIDIKILWWCSFSRVDVQANLVDRVLLGGKTIAQLHEERRKHADWWANPPWWVVGVTDLRHGHGVGLSPEGIFRRAHATPGRGLHQSELRRVPSDVMFDDLTSQKTFGATRVAELIAVSGAFPGAFGSTRFAISEDSSLQIVDGGVTDNLGYSLLMSAVEQASTGSRKQEWALEMVLISDGGMPLKEEKDIVGYTEFFRAMDVVYASSGIVVKPNHLDKVWLSPRTIDVKQLSEADRSRVPKELLKHRKVNTLIEFQKDFETARRIFLDTSTLKDRFAESLFDAFDRRYWHKDKLPGGKDAVDALFTLGQYLVYINLPDICKGLKRSLEECQATGAVSPR